MTHEIIPLLITCLCLISLFAGIVVILVVIGAGHNEQRLREEDQIDEDLR